MRAFRATALAALAALTFAAAPAPASAGPHWRGGGGHWHGGGGWHGGGWHGGGHWHGGGWGPGYWGGPGPVFGLAAGAIAGSAIAGGAYYGCIRNQPMYDAYGNYIGTQPVNVCY